MKKSFVILSVCLIAVVLLTGCNSGKNEETTAEETTGSVFSPAPGETYDDMNGLPSDIIPGVSSGEAASGTSGNTSAGSEEAYTDAAGTTAAHTSGSSEGTDTPTQDNSASGGSSAGQLSPGNQSSGNQSSSGQSSSGGSSSAPVQVPANNEYDIVRSGTFYIKGSMVESNGVSSPLEMAVTSDSVYMLSEFSEGVDIGMLMKNGTMYMIYPKEKAYMEMNDSIMKMVGIDMNEMVESDAVNFSEFGSLSEAYSVVNEIYNGIDCQVYYIDAGESGSMRVYMNGDRLLRFAKYSDEGVFLTATEVDSISGTVPADKSAPPAGYKAYKGITGVAGFMGLLSDVM